MKSQFSFVDLFSGIGGFRISLQNCGGKCLGFSEIDSKAVDTYKQNFLKTENNEWELGNIQNINYLKSDVDVLVGGVPCQSWSVAGKKRGFEDPRGRLWEDAIRLVKLNQPKVFIFENVKGLADPRNKDNLELIVSSLIDAGYDVPKPQLLNSYDFGLPQNRARIFIVGFRKDIELSIPFNYPKSLNKKNYLYNFIEGVETTSISKNKFNPTELFGEKVPFSRNIFQKNDELNDFFIFCDTRNGHTSIHSWDIVDTTEREKEICFTILRNRRKKIYGQKDGNPMSFADLSILISDLKMGELTNLITKKILKSIGDNKFDFVNTKNSSGINGIYRVYLPQSNIFSTLTATGTKDYVATVSITGNSPEDYRNNFIKLVYKKGNYRQITPREAGLLQGFPKSFVYNSSNRFAQKQFGNAVSVNVVQNLMKSIITTGIFDKISHNPISDNRRKTEININRTVLVDQKYLIQEPQTKYPQVWQTKIF